MNVHRQPTFLPIADHNVVTASVRLLGRFARKRRVRSVRNPRNDLQCLTTDPDIRRGMATAVAKQLRERLPNGESVDEAEKDFTDAIVPTADLMIPRKRKRRDQCYLFERSEFSNGDLTKKKGCVRVCTLFNLVLEYIT